MTAQTTQTIIPEGSSYTASIWIFQTCSSGRWDAGCRRRTYLWGSHHDRWTQQLNYISNMVECCQLSILSERYCYSVDQLLSLRIQHWGRGGVSPSKHARSSATLFDGKGARFIILFLTKFVDVRAFVTQIFTKLLRNNEALYILWCYQKVRSLHKIAGLHHNYLHAGSLGLLNTSHSKVAIIHICCLLISLPIIASQFNEDNILFFPKNIDIDK